MALGGCSFCGVWALQRGWRAAASCGQLKAAAIVKARGGCSGSEAVVAASSSPCRRVPALGASVATFRWQHSVRVVVSLPRRPAVSSPRRRRRVIAVVVVVASSPASILTPRPSPPVLVVALSCHPSPPLSCRRRRRRLVVVAARRRSSLWLVVAASSRGLHKCIHIGIHTSIHIGIHKRGIHCRGVSNCGSEAGAAATVSAWGCS